MSSRRRLVKLIGSLAAGTVAVAATLVGITLAAGPAAAAGTGVGYLRTQGNRIVDSTGATVRLTGINWFGMETDNRTFHGLWANPPATWSGQIDRMASLGFNTLRIPYARDALQPGATATSINTWTNPDLVGLSPLQILDTVINYAGSKGMRVILDRHRPTAAGQTPLWYTPAVSEASMIADWQMLAQRYAGNTTVIGADLFNEPHADGTDPNGTGACWGCGDTARDWRLAAQRIGNAVLQTNPNWLIFVEGVSCLSGGTPNAWDGIPDPWQNCDWWGGNLSQAIAQPVQLSVANRLVYAPHDYAISVYDRQPWFNDPNYPNNLPAVWDHFWGNIAKQSVAPIMLGEFGSTLANPLDTQWLTTLMNYLTTNGMSFTYWSWNPNSGDTGGIALDDWYSINQTKYNILQPHLVPPVPTGSQPPTTTSSSQPPQVPGPPGTPTTSGVTANSVTLNWSASSGTVTNYQIERCQGSTCTNFAQVGTSTTTSFTNTGLTANTAYRYRVRATNSVGNSAYSGIVNVTTSGTTSPPPPGGCSAALTVQTAWSNGYVMQPNTVSNTGTSTINGWTVTFTLPAGHTITNFWNATVTISGQTVTARGISGQNTTLGSGASTTWGFQATRPDGNTQLPAGPTCTSP
jgi:endoglucanase